MDIIRSYGISGLTGICPFHFAMFLVTTASAGHGDVPGLVVLVRIIGSLISYKQLLDFFLLTNTYVSSKVIQTIPHIDILFAS